MNNGQLLHLRKSNSVPFQIVRWLAELSPIVEHEDLGMLYKGLVLVEDEYGQYAAVVGTSEQLLKIPPEACPNPYRILRVEQNVLPFGRRTKSCDNTRAKASCK